MEKTHASLYCFLCVCTHLTSFILISALCSANLTVVFVLDGSYKISEANFTEVGNFVNNVSSHFDVAINKTWIITTVEGNDTIVYKTKAEVNNSITLPFPNNSQVLLGKALEAAKDRLRDNDTQREAVVVVVVLITSQKSDDDIAVPSIDLKRMRATIFAVGIGDGVSLGQLREIASDPDDQYFVESKDTNDLLAKSTALATKICQGRYTVSGPFLPALKSNTVKGGCYSTFKNPFEIK